MQRYASHYLYFPSFGYLKSYAVEVDAGRVIGFVPFSGEVEDTLWLPGIIVVAPADAVWTMPTEPVWLTEVPSLGDDLSALLLYHIYPFDFTSMQPVGGTRRRLWL